MQISITVIHKATAKEGGWNGKRWNVNKNALITACQADMSRVLGSVPWRGWHLWMSVPSPTQQASDEAPHSMGNVIFYVFAEKELWVKKIVDWHFQDLKKVQNIDFYCRVHFFKTLISSFFKRWSFHNLTSLFSYLGFLSPEMAHCSTKHLGGSSQEALMAKYPNQTMGRLNEWCRRQLMKVCAQQAWEFCPIIGILKLGIRSKD